MGFEKLNELSIIIPIAKEEQQHLQLINDLNTLSPDIEIILSGPNSEKLTLPKNIKWVSGPLGRAEQLNAGANQASKKWLLFLHADSRVCSDAFRELNFHLKLGAPALSYFNLSFYNGSWLMKLNAWGANFRSRLLGMPFGDQGFCISKSDFFKVGGFPTEISYGEDHVFAWRCRRHGLRLKALPATINTSARKYIELGWWNTTLRHVYLTFKQAGPEWRKLQQSKR